MYLSGTRSDITHAEVILRICFLPIKWRNLLVLEETKSVALSSNEAEYVSLSDAAKEAIFLSSLLGELGFADLSRTIIYNDNQSAGKLATNLYKPTEEMIADILSKALPKPKVDFCTKGLEISRQE
ncbi:hypothetical protein TKK_0017640 [Trichogramma kaykai]